MATTGQPSLIPDRGSALISHDNAPLHHFHVTSDKLDRCRRDVRLRVSEETSNDGWNRMSGCRIDITEHENKR